VQGYLRKVVNGKVFPTSWADADKALPYVSILKADETELLFLTGKSNVLEGVESLFEKGVKEVVVTNGSKGSQIYVGGKCYPIPAYFPDNVIDTTGCGDTYMAGYLYQKAKDGSLQQAGEFAAAMAGLKTMHPGPFFGSADDVVSFLSERR
jgi:sugar/nucleoside kinase (ribokinase family)